MSRRFIQSQWQSSEIGDKTRRWYPSHE